MSEDLLQRRLARAQAKVARLEQLLEDKTRELYVSNQELTESNRFMGGVLRSMAGGLMVVNAAWHIELVNDRICGITGLRADELVGEHVWRLLPEAGTYRPDELGTAHEEDTWLNTVQGSIPVALTHGALPDGGGHVYVVIDARERKEAEAALRYAQKELLATSRKAGMTEVATGVIHDVGNVVTAVNVAIQQLLSDEEQSRVGSLGRIVDLLAAQDDLAGFFAGPKGAKVPAFLATLHERLIAEQRGRREQLLNAADHLAHVATVISAQQRHAKRVLVVEDVRAAELVDQALALYQSRIADLGVSIERNVDEALVLHSDRHQLIQIVVNLVSNALDALERWTGNRRLQVQALRSESTGRASIVVRDSGMGIAPENLDRIFAHGFTTRVDGHGFGLHAAANAATQLGGTLACASEGEGRGAEFVLDVPLQAPAEAA